MSCNCLPIVSVFLFLLFQTPNAKAQENFDTPADTSLANKHFARAFDLANQAKFDSSIIYYEKARKIYEIILQRQDNLIVLERDLKCLNNIGLNLWRLGRYEKAMGSLNKVKDIGTNILGENHLIVALNYQLIGLVFYEKKNFDKAIGFLTKSLAIYQKLLGDLHNDTGDVFNILGLVYDGRGEYEIALEFYNKSLTSYFSSLKENHHNFANVYSNIGMIYKNKGYYDKALEYYNKSLKVLHSLQQENHNDAAITFNNIGVLHEIIGDYDKALFYFNKSLRITQQLFGDSHPSIANTCYNIGVIYRHKGNYDKALEQYNKSFRIRLRVFGNNHPAMSQIYNAMGVVYTEKGEYVKALDYYNKSLRIKLQYLGEYHPYLANTYNNIGMLHKKNNEYNKAIDYFNKSLSILLHSDIKKNPNIATVYTHIGLIYRDQNSLAKALFYYQKSIQSLVANNTDSSIYINPILENISSENDLLTSLEAKADALKELYSVKSNSTTDIKTSLSTYHLALQLIDKIRSGYKTEGAKLSLAEKASRISEKAIQTALQMYSITGENRYKEQAFLFAEKSKSTVLLEAISESAAQKFAGIPDSLLQKEKALKIDLAFYDTRIQNAKQQEKRKRDSLKIKDYEDRFFTLSRKYDLLIEHFEKKYPKYYDLKYRSQTVSVADLQKTLDDKTVVLEYFVGDNSCYIFTLSSKIFDVIALPKDTTFETTVNNFCSSLSGFDTKKYPGYSRQLYKMLIKPIAQKIATAKKLVIIPANILSQIPFEALLTEEGETENFSRLPYLINRFEISYHYSGTLYSRAKKTTPAKGVAGFIGFAPIFSESVNNGVIVQFVDKLIQFEPTFTTAASDAHSYLVTRDGKKLDELLYTEDEVNSIRLLFSGHGLNGQTFVHQEASEENFKNRIGRYKYVHVATHGFINNSNPKLSNLAFTQPQDSLRQEDGILYSAETFNLDLNADLVVLSACKTGIGKLYKGEGMIALSRGFLYSGAANIVVSLWQVMDQRASDLMVKFYQNILTNKNYSQSLRQAKLAMIKNADSAFPGYWSVFTLIGK